MPKVARGFCRAILLSAAMGSSAVAAEVCTPGIYGSGDDAFVVIGPSLSASSPDQRYLFIDGRRGSTGEKEAIVTCASNIAVVKRPGGGTETWARRATAETGTSFDSAGTRLAGRLIEPPGPMNPSRPLAVMIHGSEKTPALENVYAYMLAAQGVSVFVYDKRGTGASAGEYTQNFELLADDAAAALVQARKMAAGRFGRAGYFGGSQGGWVAPLAATRSQADFVAVGFGLVVSPIEEDREQLLDEARRMGLDAKAIGQLDQLSRATARLLGSHFTNGFEELAEVKRGIGNAAWAAGIRGEHSGDMLRMSEADLRRIGRARFDNLELIWNYDAEAVLAKLNAPLLWVLAAEDREAPIAQTRAVLSRRMNQGQEIDAYVFPDTDHGMAEFRVDPDGTRSITRITDGYLRLLGDWMKGRVGGRYGRSAALQDPQPRP